MAKDYFQDILPPDNGAQPPRPAPPRMTPPPAAPAPQTAPLDTEQDASEERSIRNVTVPNRIRPTISRDAAIASPRFPGRKRSALWLWLIGLAALIIIGVGVAVSMRQTKVTVTPRLQMISFDPSYSFTAYPEAVAASDTLPYLVQSFDFEDSELIPTSGGAAQVDHPASGTVTVVNDYSAGPVKLIKNTRFETPDHLIFRTPADITVPGKTASGPGKANVTLVADQPGSRFNTGPVSRFTVPGLKSNAPMFEKVYAMSSAPMTGGSAASESGVSADALAKAVGELRGRLQAKAIAAVNGLASTSVAFSQLTRANFVDEPSVPEGANVRIKESIHIDVPLFDPAVFAAAVARSASIDTQNGRVEFGSLSGVSASPSMASSTLGVSPITFTLSGKSPLVWNIDTAGLARALASKDRDAFQAIVNGFPGVQQAQAQIEPFWSKSFPANPESIHISVQPPETAR